MPLIKLFWEICLFRRGPQDVPSSQTLLGLSALAYFAVGLTLLGLETGWPEAAAQVLAEAVMLLGFLWATLSVAGLKSRFIRTLIAMLGTDALISSFAIPLMIGIPQSPQAQGFYFGLLLLMLWHLTVVAHIFRHALSRPLGVGLGVAIVYVVASYQMMLLLFAPTG
jgi:hypothetical protein